jgi:hypothetical protein
VASQWLIAEIPLVNRGLFGTKNVNEVPIDALIDADTVTFEDGTIRKEGGIVAYSDDAIPPAPPTGPPLILGGHDWDHDGSTQKAIVLTDAGDLRKDDGAGDFTSVILATGLTVSANTSPVFAEGGKEAAANNRKLFLATGTNAVQVLSADGATTAALATPPADWSANPPTCMFNHVGRMWGCGNANDPHRLYYSTINDHEDFTGQGSGTLAIFPGDSEGIVHAYSFRGAIIVFKYPRGIYMVDTTPVSFFDWTVRKIANNLGMANTNCGAVIPNDLIFLDATREIRLLSTVDEFGDVGTTSLSDLAAFDDWMRENINPSGRKQWRCVYYPTKKEVHFAMTGVGATENDTRVVIDFLLGRPRFRYSSRDKPISMWMRKVNGIPELTIGTNTGVVVRLDQPTRSIVSTSGATRGYVGKFRTPNIDMSHLDPLMAGRRKNGHFLEAVIQPNGNWDLNCTVYWDGTAGDTVSFNQGFAGATLGAFVLGTDVLGSQGTIFTRKRRITGGGRRFSVEASNSGKGNDFSLARLYVHFHVSDDRI